MKLVGFYIGNHDSNVAVFIDGQVKYAKSERMTGRKHHRANLAFVQKLCAEWGVGAPYAIAFSDGNRNNLGSCEIDELSKPTAPLWGNIPTFCLDHHYAHMLSAWPVCSLEQVQVGIALDGRGDNQVRARVVEHPGSHHPRILYYTQNRTYGSLLSRIGDLMGLSGLKYDFAGKLMGLQAYGQIDEEYLGRIDFERIENRILDLIFEIPWRGTPPVQIPGFFKHDNPSFVDWLATVHHAIGLYTLHFFERYVTTQQPVVFAGGCAQNTVYNEALLRRFPNLVIPPHCYDGGISLGCLEFLRIHYNLPSFARKGFPFWQNELPTLSPSTHTIKQAAQLLECGKIIGWFQGRGEIGPRALGHRSILMDPRQAKAKDILNSRVKHREAWRPYAPSILESTAGEWFDLPGPSPYMLRAAVVQDSKMDRIAAVIHADRTSRVQTVPDEGEDELIPYARLLKEFYQLTGVPMILNTSFNQGGGPIFSTPAQAIDFFKSTPLDALCLGDQLLVK